MGVAEDNEYHPSSESNSEDEEDEKQLDKVNELDISPQYMHQTAKAKQQLQEAGEDDLEYPEDATKEIRRFENAEVVATDGSITYIKKPTPEAPEDFQRTLNAISGQTKDMTLPRIGLRRDSNGS